MKTPDQETEFQMLDLIPLWDRIDKLEEENQILKEELRILKGNLTEKEKKLIEMYKNK